MLYEFIIRRGCWSGRYTATDSRAAIRMSHSDYVMEHGSYGVPLAHVVSYIELSDV